MNKLNIGENLILAIIGGVFVSGVYHFLGEGSALAVIGGWVFLNGFR